MPCFGRLGPGSLLAAVAYLPWEECIGNEDGLKCPSGATGHGLLACMLQTTEWLGVCVKMIKILQAYSETS